MSGIEACVFDAYGTLFDVHSAVGKLRGDVGPLKTVFATLFFSSIGMYLNLEYIGQNLPILLAVLAAVVLGKPAVIWVVGKLVGLPHRYALAAGICMGQIGIFSFVLAQVALDDSSANGIINEWLFDLMINVTILTLFLTPTLTRIALPVGGATERVLRRLRLTGGASEQTKSGSAVVEGHVIIIGFGPAGRAVADPELGDRHR